MISVIRRLFRASAKKIAYDTLPSPDQMFIAVGDIHGRLDLLDKLLSEISLNFSNVPIVFLGDYVDRGPQSAQVLMHLKYLQSEASFPVKCLKGNHEQMFLDFLDDPENMGERWLRYGGDATARSFGTDEDMFVKLRDQLLNNAAPGLIDWVRDLPVLWQSGNVVASHAGANPYKLIEARRSHSLVWGHEDFLKVSRTDGQWLVHGHYPMEDPRFGGGRISIDTGAYKTNRLTAAVISNEKVEFLSAYIS